MIIYSCLYLASHWLKVKGLFLFPTFSSEYEEEEVEEVEERRESVVEPTPKVE